MQEIQTLEADLHHHQSVVKRIEGELTQKRRRISSSSFGALTPRKRLPSDARFNAISKKARYVNDGENSEAKT